MTTEESVALAYIRAGLQAGCYLFLPQVLYANAVTILRAAGVSEEEISRVRETKPIPLSA